jgi:cell division protein FtsL
VSAGPATAHRPAVRRSPSPRAPRRVSGPARPRQRPTATRSAATVAAPAFGVPSPLAPRALEALLRLPDNRWLDRLLRGRAWIAIIALALIGLVFMQVSMLGMNAGVGRAVERSGTLERQNADLRATVSALSSEERIQRAAADMGMLMPQAGDVRFLQSRGAMADAVHAAKVMRAPNPTVEATAVAGAAAGTQAATPPAPTPASQQATAEAQQPPAAPAAPQAQAAAPQVPAPAPAPSQQVAPQPQPQAAQPTQQAAAPQPAPQAAPATGAAVAPGTGQ